MDLLKIGNIDLDMFSPKTQKALVTLDETSLDTSGLHVEMPMDSVLFQDGDINYSPLNQQMSDMVSTPRNKNRKSLDPVKLQKYEICYVCQTSTHYKTIECDICSKKCHRRCCFETDSDFNCCLTCKNMPKRNEELKDQIDKASVINKNLVKLLQQRDDQYNRILQILESVLNKTESTSSNFGETTATPKSCEEPGDEVDSHDSQNTTCSIKPIPAPRMHKRKSAIILSDSIPKIECDH